MRDPAETRWLRHWDRLASPIWSPDGTKIAFTNYSFDGYPNTDTIYISDVDGTSLNRIPNGHSVYDLFEVDNSPDISPDGSRVAYSTFRYSTGFLRNSEHSYEIVTSRLDGSDVKRLTRDKYGNHSPVWSPDGERIAYVSDRELATREHLAVYTMASDGSDVRNIGTTGRSGWPNPLPRWSPDGRHIAYYDFDGALTPSGIYRTHFVAVARADGSGSWRVVESYPSIGNPVWSPDSKRIAFTRSYETETALYVIDLDGSNERKIFADPTLSVDPSPFTFNVSWSADGSELRFKARIEDPLGSASGLLFPGIYSIKLDGTGLRLVTDKFDRFDRNYPHTEYDRATAFSWSPDDSLIAIYDSDGPIVLRTISSDGQDERVLVRLVHRQHVAEYFGWQEVAEDYAACSEGTVVLDPLTNQELVKDCEALLRFRDELDEGAMLNWNGAIPLKEWYGVTVAGSPARVERLELPGGPIGGYTTLTGTIPPEIGHLTGLKRLRLFGHQITGEIPPELGNLAEVTEILLQENDLTGHIPPELGLLPNLEVLGLHDNNLTGCVPETLARNPNLSIGTDGLEPC